MKTFVLAIVTGAVLAVGVTLLGVPAPLGGAASGLAASSFWIWYGRRRGWL